MVSKSSRCRGVQLGDARVHLLNLIGGLFHFRDEHIGALFYPF